MTFKSKEDRWRAREMLRQKEISHPLGVRWRRVVRRLRWAPLGFAVLSGILGALAVDSFFQAKGLADYSGSVLLLVSSWLQGFLSVNELYIRRVSDEINEILESIKDYCDDANERVCEVSEAVRWLRLRGEP